VGGFSLQAALAADLTTFLTTHIAALHVYSSLLVTAQLAAAGRLFRLVNPPPTRLVAGAGAELEGLGGAGGGAGASTGKGKGDAGAKGSGASGGEGSGGGGSGAEARKEKDDDELTRKSESGAIHEHKKNVSFGLTRLEATVVGVLALTPLMLLLPTTLAFYLSYLALHTLTVAARAAMVLASAALQYPPLHLVALRLVHPHAFPGGVVVTPVPVPAPVLLSPGRGVN
jgi:hypothetical protein